LQRRIAFFAEAFAFLLAGLHLLGGTLARQSSPAFAQTLAIDLRARGSST
jgi:hypothetical protein